MITEIFADKPFRPGGGERDRRQCDQPVAELGHQVMMVKIMMMIKLISVMMTMAMMIMIKIIMLPIIRAEERHKLVTASLNFYKTAEQVPTLPTISFPSLLSTSSDQHRAGANHGLPAYSHHDKIPPWWEYVSNYKGGNVSVSKSHHTG